MSEEKNEGFGAGVGDNSRQAALAAPFIKEIDEEQAKIDKIMKKAQAECGPYRDTMNAKKKKMRKETGLTAKASNIHISLCTQQRRLKEKIDALDDDDRHDFDVLFDEIGQGYMQFGTDD